MVYQLISFCTGVVRLDERLNLSGACTEEKATRYQVAFIFQNNESAKYRYQQQTCFGIRNRDLGEKLIHVTTTDGSKRKTQLKFWYLFGNPGGEGIAIGPGKDTVSCFPWIGMCSLIYFIYHFVNV